LPAWWPWQGPNSPIKSELGPWKEPSAPMVLRQEAEE